MASDGPTVVDPPRTPSRQSTSPRWSGTETGCPFNIYIHDHSVTRGFRKTAHELQVVAAIPATTTPPINAKQGLLSE
ncbi:hypothetical protein LXA43DRAFT_1099819 [Ganoderma leucocontextum]|nr:hypothetical protein LXA43DRAFT_1099819 [Ganoderma leucocontextum]